MLTNEAGFLEIDLKVLRRWGIRKSTCAPEEAGKRDWVRGHAELGRNKVKQKKNVDAERFLRLNPTAFPF